VRLKILVLSLALAQAKVSLDETLTWLVNFSKEHGHSIEVNTGRKLDVTTLRLVDGCSIEVEHEFQVPSRSKLRKRTETISLGDFDPAKIELPPAGLTVMADNPVFTLKMKTSDSERKIPATLEMTDGSKKKVLIAQEHFDMDSREAAFRFQKALAHAVNLCGGQRSPF